MQSELSAAQNIFRTPLRLNQQYDIIYRVETIKSDVRERICQPSVNASVEKGWAPWGKQVPKVARPAQRRATAFFAEALGGYNRKPKTKGARL